MRSADPVGERGQGAGRRDGGVPPECRGTYRRHLVYALLEAAAAGILANAPVMALRGMQAPEWQMALQMVLSSAGMLAAVYLGGVMAERRKMPFVTVPGLGFAACALGMAATTDALAFLVLNGVGTLLETLARPAVAAVIRLGYPATHRGAATGSVRRWHALVFLATGVASAGLLDLAGDAARTAIAVQLVTAGGLAGAAYGVFRTIRVGEGGDAGEVPPAARPMREAWDVVRRDGRFRRYAAIGLLYAFGGMIYVSFLPVLLTNRLDCGYLESAFLLQVLPGGLAFASTGAIGRWLDRVNPWRAWAWIRAGWGADAVLLAATPALAATAPVAAMAVAVAGRACRGLVMGGSWILWWQIGVNHFAPPGGDTTRYAGILIFVNGIARLAGPVAGAWILGAASVEAALLAGGGVVLVSALLSAREARREAGDAGLATMAAFEQAPPARPRP